MRGSRWWWGHEYLDHPVGVAGHRRSQPGAAPLGAVVDEPVSGHTGEGTVEATKSLGEGIGYSVTYHVRQRRCQRLM